LDALSADRPRTLQGTGPRIPVAGDGSYGAITELAVAERIDHSYVGRVLRLTLLPPDIVEAVLNGRQPLKATLATLMRRVVFHWADASMR
jgi:hypothetical protein